MLLFTCVNCLDTNKQQKHRSIRNACKLDVTYCPEINSVIISHGVVPSAPHSSSHQSRGKNCNTWPKNRIGALDLFSSHCRVSAVEALPPYWYGEHVTIFRPFGLLGIKLIGFYCLFIFRLPVYFSFYDNNTPLFLLLLLLIYYYYYYNLQINRV